ncbi:N-acetylmannosamine kinase [Psychromonas hadalis]|uniref:N-acetylmannosamine kinase n=1 Tax=Psychromonas hadalis TaxID=211669 RepID=UPI0003B3D550|nr:N-acetylmannosamine kinase [Psychromonas hadalis]
MNTCLAIDIGGTKIAAALICNGVVSKRSQMKTPSSSKTSAMDEALKSMIQPLLSEADYIAVASTGIIDKGILKALNPDNLGGLNLYPLQQTVAHLSQLTVFVINDAQAAAWAEYQHTSNISNMAFITVSTGVGTGLVINNQLLIGSRGVAGHAGHMLADPNGPVCGCGRRGCVESIASGTAIANAGKDIWGDLCTGQFVFEKFLAGNLQAEKIIHQSARVIANLIADLTISLDLELVKLGGSVGLATGYLAIVRQYLSQMPMAHQSHVISAQCAADAGLVGVAQWANNQYSVETNS